MSNYFVRIKFAMLIWVILAFFIPVQNTYAAFGEGCPGGIPIVQEELQYLEGKTAYGYVKQSLNVTEYVPTMPADSAAGDPTVLGAITQCKNNVESISVCIRNDALNPPCDIATFTPSGGSVPLSRISRSPLLGKNPLLSTLTLKAEYIGVPSCHRIKNSEHRDVWTCMQKLCLTTPTPYGNKALLCKPITKVSTNPPADDTAPVCTLVAASCNQSKSSQSMFSFTGPAVECLHDTLHSIFFDPQPDCVGDTNVNMSFLASFSSFQESLKVTVRALLILYTMGYGITLLMNPGKLDAEGVVMFFLKMILVGYFSVGWGPAYFASNGVKTTHSGMLEWGLPILTEMTADLAAITFSSGDGGRGLCDFDNTRYPAGKGYFGLWDRVDCKLGAYIMVKKIYGFGFLGATAFSNGWAEISHTQRDKTDPLGSVNMNGSPSKAAAQVGMSVIIFLMLLGGNIIVAIGLLYFVCIIVALILGFVSLYTVCLVTLHVLIYLSPIFVPMALFHRTKTYFDSWLKLTLSCALQPMVMGGFIAFAMNMYDDVLFGGCQFKRHDYSNGTRFFSTFEPRLPQGDYSSCVKTPGFMIINYILGYGWSDYGAIFFTVDYAKDELNLLANTCLLIIFSYIMGFFFDQVYSMSSDLTGGLNVATVALNMKNMARAMQNKLSELGSKASDKAKGPEKEKSGGDKGGGDKGGGDKGGGNEGGGGKESSMGGGK